jgi:hypothetical protein
MQRSEERRVKLPVMNKGVRNEISGWVSARTLAYFPSHLTCI